MARKADLDRRAVVAGASLAVPAGRAAAATLDFGAVQARLEAAVAAGAVPWARLLVTRGGKDLYVHAVGTDLDQVDVLRSATKIATVTAVLTLVDQGKLRLEDPVMGYIPAFGAEKASVTVRHLLSMNSGLPASWRAFSDETSLAVAADVIAQAPLAAQPGARFIYGNLGLTVAGRVAEVVSGKPWDAFFQAAVAGPLGIDFTYGPLDTGRLGGGGRTNLLSYGTLLRMHLAKGMHGPRRFLSAELVEAMQHSNGSAFVNPFSVATEAHGYGMGWWFDAVKADGEARIVSDPGAWGAYPWIDWDRRYGAFLFISKSLGAGARLQRDLRPLVERTLDA